MNVNEIITKRIIERIEDAKASGKPFKWVRPWSGGPTKAVSYTTGKPYRGINLLLLDAGSEYITYKAIKDMNESLAEDEKIYVKKGSHTVPVMYYDTYDLKDENGEPILDEYGNQAKKWFGKYYLVFNREDCRNLHSHFPAEKKLHTNSKATKLLDKYINAFVKAEGITLDIVEDGTNCFYRPSEHMVRIPDRAGFKSIYAYYSSALHEFVHSTSKGLNRKLGENFGTESYSREELIAQIGSQLLLNHFKIVCDEEEEINDIAYIDGWVSHLKEHEREISIAALQAEKAMNYFLEVAEKQLSSKCKKVA